METVSTDLRDSLIGSYINTHNTSYPTAVTAVTDALTHGTDSPHATEFAKAIKPLYEETAAYIRTVCNRIPQQVHDAVSDGTAQPGGEIIARIDDDIDAWERGQDSMRWTP